MKKPFKLVSQYTYAISPIGTYLFFVYQNGTGERVNLHYTPKFTKIYSAR